MKIKKIAQYIVFFTLLLCFIEVSPKALNNSNGGKDPNNKSVILSIVNSEYIPAAVKELADNHFIELSLLWSGAYADEAVDGYQDLHLVYHIIPYYEQVPTQWCFA
jgi:hypothetical protein